MVFQLDVLDCARAGEFKPSVPSVAIILLSGIREDNNTYPAVLSRKFVEVFEYKFDNLYPIDERDMRLLGRGGDFPIIFNAEIAGKMLFDFTGVRDKVSGLMVHCWDGRNRAPAVAIAYNDVFSFGYDREELMMKHPAYNSYICQTLIDTAGKIGIPQLG